MGYGPRMPTADDGARTSAALLRGVYLLVLVMAISVLLNRLLWERAWADALWRSVQFAVPFAIVYTALMLWMQRRGRYN